MQSNDYFSCDACKEALINSYFVLILRGPHIRISRQTFFWRLYEKAAFSQEFEKRSFDDQFYEFLTGGYSLSQSPKYKKTSKVNISINRCHYDTINFSITILWLLVFLFLFHSQSYSFRFSFSFSLVFSLDAFSPNFLLFSSRSNYYL